MNKLIEEFKKRKVKGINEEFFIQSLILFHDKFKSEYPTIDDALKIYSLEYIVDVVLASIDDIKIIEEKPKIKIFEFNNKKKCCLAPYSTINFDTMGHIRVCCYNNYFLLGEYPKTSIKDAWNNKEKDKFIDNLKNKNFPIGCDKCELQIIEDNTSNALFSSFDSYENHINNNFPIAFNFDFGNICNYECIMCGGKWSSSIRKNREKLPALKSPYDDEFVNQLKEFIPTMVKANFLGGEPFLNFIYYKIWDLMYEINPKLIINITTNGSIFNNRIKEYLEKLPNISITVSLDSLNEETYQFIRKNGNFKNVMDNIEEFKKLKKFKGLAFCPMIQNIYELPDIIIYCINNNLCLAINDVSGPLGGKIKGIHEGELHNTNVWLGSSGFEKININKDELIPEVALKTLSKDKLKDIINYLKKFDFNQYPIYDKKYKDFINSLMFYI
jgi:MoaA/NifB/PqqE/SkfB family radical SAM enzyme